MADEKQPHPLRVLLDELEGLEEFGRAPRQFEALSIMVEAAISGRTITGSDLAERLYGKSDTGYVRAAQQLVRDVRFKLARINAGRPTSEPRIELAESGYRVFLREPDFRREVGARRSRSWLLAGATVIATLALAAAVMRARRAEEPRPARLRVRDATVEVLDARERRLPAWEDAIRSAFLVPRGGTPYGEILPGGRAAFLGRADGGRDVAVLTCDPISDYACRIVVLDGSTAAPRDGADLPLFPSVESRPAVLHERAGEDLPPWFVVSGLVSADLDGDGLRDELVATVRQHRSFPCAVLGIDPAAGWEVVFDYWAMGEVVPYPLSRAAPGEPDDILLHGTNNSTWSPYVVVLPPVTQLRVRPSRSPGGDRVAVMTEVADRPEAGLAIRLPSSALASPRFPEYGSARGDVSDLTWDPDRRRLHLFLLDGARSLRTGDWLRYEVVLDLGSGTVDVLFLTYDQYLEEFRKLVGSGRLEDRWNIGAGLKLDAYGDELKGGIEWRAPSSHEEWTSVGLVEALRARLEGTQ